MTVPIIDGVPFGKTNPVANCATHYAVPVNVAMMYVDERIHGVRTMTAVGGYVCNPANSLTILNWMVENNPDEQVWDDLEEIAARMPRYHQRREQA